MEAKKFDESRIILSQMMGVQDANLHGNVHGGVIMRLVDVAGALAAMRHAGRPVVTVAIDSMTFKRPIHIGNVVTTAAQLTYVGRTSMEVRVDVTAEHEITGEITHTNSAFVVYVALDDDGRPCEVPSLIIETEEQQARWAVAEERQKFRKAQREQEESLNND